MDGLLRTIRLGAFTCTVIFFVCASVCPCDAAEGCDKHYGPAGVKTCITSDGVYTDSQWATCLTNVYIRIKSGGRHMCFDPLAVYCYYQCMVEDHDVELGNVSDNCLCVPNISSTTPSIETTTSLPTWCLSPPGTNCSWYDQCLQLKYNCDDASNSYIIHYARLFCSLNIDKQSKFTTVAQQWMGNVSKCLQVSLVPFLRPWESPSCAGIRNRAFGLYKDCYRSSFIGAPSICDLPTYDWWRIFWTMKAPYIHAATSLLVDLLSTKKGCPNNNLSGSYEHIRVVKILVRRINVDLGYSDNTTQYTEDDMFVGTISSIIAAILGWPSKGVGWFTTSSTDMRQSKSDDSLVNATIILSDVYALNVDYNYSHIRVNLTVVVDELTNAVRVARLNVFVTDWPEPLDIRHIYVCEDVYCNNIIYNTTIVKADTSNCNRITDNVSTLIICLIFWYFIIKSNYL